MGCMSEILTNKITLAQVEEALKLRKKRLTIKQLLQKVYT